MQSMTSSAISLLLLLFLEISRAHAAIPQTAREDPEFHLGRLKCTHYVGVFNNETGNSTAGLQTCIADAWANTLAVLIPCGTYLINNTLTAYEWQNWATTSWQNPHPRNHVIVGSQIGGCTPTLKLMPGSSGFTSASAPRPMLSIRGFRALNSSAVPNAAPSNPLGTAANFKDHAHDLYQVVLRNIKFDTNDNAGAIGVAFPSAQLCTLVDVEVDATNSFAGIYGLPGRNSLTGNVTVTGGQHCLGGGSVWGLSPSLDNTVGNTLAGITCTGQTGTAIEIHDSAPTVLTGLHITKSATGAPIRIRSPVVLVDAKIELSGSAANILAIDNSDGLPAYVRNTWIKGSTNLIKNGSSATHTGTGTWVRIAESAYGDTFSQDSSSNPATVYPTYPQGQDRFEDRALINGSLTGGGLAFFEKFDNASAPPDDLRSRHVVTIPSSDDGPFIDPTGLGDCDAVKKIADYGIDGTNANSGPDCTAEIQKAIDDARDLGHNRVVIPNGYLSVSGSINLHPNTILIGAGPGMISMIGYRSTWSPTQETYFVTTDSNATGSAFMGFFAFFVRTQPAVNQVMSFFHWRIGANSATMSIGYERQHVDPAVDNNPLKHLKFSGNGGGRHYGNHQFIGQIDSHKDVRAVLVQGTTQPLSFYGLNTEITKPQASSDNAYADFNAEITDATNVRWYGCKREGKSPTAKIHNSRNVAIYGCGSMTGTLIAGKAGFVQITGTSTDVVVAVQRVGENVGAANGEVMLREALSPTPTPPNGGSVSPWPNGVSYYRRGQIDDTPFSSSPSVTAPTLLNLQINAANRIDLEWEIFDQTAMLPSTGVTGVTVTVDGVSTPIASSTRVGLNTYQLAVPAANLLTNTQVVVVSYVPGNITAGGTGMPPATAFSNATATNNLPPTPVAFLEQVTVAARSIYGDLTEATAPWYTGTAGGHENVPLFFTPGARFRLPMQVKNTVAAAAPQSLMVCYRKNETGSYALLPETCTAADTCFTEAPELADRLPTAQVLTPTGFTFIPGAVLEHANTQVLVALPENSETLYEPAILITDTASVGSRYQYRLCTATGALFDANGNGAYSHTPLVTVVHGQGLRTGGGSIQ